MCLAIPLRVQSILSPSGAVAGESGAEVDIDISLVPDVRPGDYVIVHAGFAIQILTPEDAEERIELYRDVAQADTQGPRPG